MYNLKKGLCIDTELNAMLFLIFNLENYGKGKGQGHPKIDENKHLYPFSGH
jgi:hypothetical protein